MSDRLLVCGLGSLGQQCVASLHSFGVEVTAIDLDLLSVWELPDLPTLLTEAIAGDCCQTSVLERAGVRDCRAILLVTESDRVNVEAAFGTSSNTSIRCVMPWSMSSSKRPR